MQDCERFDEALDAWREGELPQTQVRRLREHLDACARCREELRLAAEIHASTRALPALRPARPFLPPAPKGRRLWPLPSISRPATAALAAAGVIAAVVLLWTVLPDPASQSPLEAELARAAGEDYSRRELEAALADLRLALGYLQQYNQFTQSLVADEVGREVMKLRLEPRREPPPADPAG